MVVQWKLALVTMSVIPIIMTIMILIMTIQARLETSIISLHSQAAAIAQEALSSIKTVHAFACSEKLIANYDKFSKAAHNKTNLKRPNVSIGNGVFNFCVHVSTALAFWQGLCAIPLGCQLDFMAVDTSAFHSRG